MGGYCHDWIKFLNEKDFDFPDVALGFG